MRPGRYDRASLEESQPPIPGEAMVAHATFRVHVAGLVPDGQLSLARLAVANCPEHAISLTEAGKAAP